MTPPDIPAHGFGQAKKRAVLIVGGSGGIGGALMKCVASKLGANEECHVWSRSEVGSPQAGVITHSIDILDEATIAEAAAALPPVRLAIVATGSLHTDAGAGPEKSWRDLNAEVMAQNFAVNAIGPALVAKHVLPRIIKHERAVFAALSARVSSMADNRLGGWYSYRASKAALNQLIKTLSIELARSRPKAICIGLHPGTVDTGLSEPFQGNVPNEQLFTPDEAARHLLSVIDGRDVSDTGGLFAWDSKRIPF